jgi:serine/threonine-protein phosphatase PPG1
MFDFLTLCVVIDDAIFCVHGGLSPSIHHIDQIKILDRFREIPHEGPMADLVWSDPDPEKEDFAISPRFVDKISYMLMSQRRWIHVRSVNCPQIPQPQWDESRPQSASTLYGGLLGPVRRSSEHCMECTQLLLQVSFRDESS